MTNQDLPKIKKVADVGETTFSFVEKTESILQGWDSQTSKTVYLFKTDSGSWGYFDKATGQVLEIAQWKGKAALVNDRWIKMVLYHRVQLIFTQPVNYTGWDKENRKQTKETAQEALVTITDSAYKALIEQMNGRPAESIYKFAFITKKIGQRNVTYVDKAVWVS